MSALCQIDGYMVKFVLNFALNTNPNCIEWLP